MKFSSVAYFLASCLMIAACATQVAPTGGPEDKLPPRVAGVLPAPKTANHPNELYVKLEFDEWINASIPRGAITISPPIEKKLRYEVHGKTLEVYSRAELDTGTTYTVTFASGIKDLRGNALAKPFQVVFSTGAIIDSLTLSGRVMVSDSLVRKKAYPSVGLYLMGSERESKRYLEKYRDTTTKVLDSLPMLTKEEPLYLTAADSIGSFTFTGLKAGRYRVVAFVDGNGNHKIEPSSELAGVWVSDLVLTESTSDTLWIALADQDTSLLEMGTLSQPNANILEANFTRHVYFDSAFADTSNCYMTSANGDTLYPRFVYLGTSSAPRFYFDPKPKDEVLYKFLCRSGKDSLNRALDTARNYAEIEWKEMEGDTLAPSIQTVKITGKAKKAFPDDSLIVIYNKPVLDSLKDLFFIVENKDTTQVEVKKLDPIRYVVQRSERWPTDSKFSLLRGYADTTLAKADSNGVRDTVIQTKYQSKLVFETISKLKFGSMVGRIPGAKSGAIVRLKSAETGKFEYAKCSAHGAFAFNDLVEGDYIIDYYYAEEGSDLPSGGSLQPFKYGSAWRAPLDTLKIKSGPNDLDQLMPNLPALP
ncbi:Ig-like domain-containing domain [Fibrobacter sp. UWB7]|uniref:Ig-like domain-containing domain n=1 Tax=Fibrobacter sp. UWB7 TaxID=1896206 RepID=UPI000915DCCA|nr:Ig-like domain-containing domain [Fibrobacter sp. UWB7]SHM89673.1 Ig-like domain-containing protein [Fibrobacter sp. UWB7]